MTITLTWHAADGATIVLDGTTGYRVTRGAMGLDVPPVSNTVDPYMVFDGSALISRRRNARSVTLPLFIKHASRAQTLLAVIASAFQGPGRLEYNDGTVDYELRDVIYDGGMLGDQSGVVSKVWRRVVVSLLALDPWWYGDAQSTALSISASTAFSAAVPFSAAIPFDGGNSSSVVVAGVGEAYPVITVTGPATTATASLGLLAWTNATALGSGDVLVVDTRPGNRGPRLNGGDVDWSLLTPGSRLWTLQPGTNSVVSGATGTSGATSIVMQWEPRYLTP
jgi:hypothetical protein